MKKLFILLALFSANLFATPVNVNKADAPTIVKSLKGIGSVKAKAIVAYRKKNGSYKTADELLKVKGIGKKTLLNNKSDILLIDATAAVLANTKKDAKATTADAKKAVKVDPKATKADAKKAVKVDPKASKFDTKKAVKVDPKASKADTKKAVKVDPKATKADAKKAVKVDPKASKADTKKAVKSTTSSTSRTSKK